MNWTEFARVASDRAFVARYAGGYEYGRHGDRRSGTNLILINVRRSGGRWHVAPHQLTPHRERLGVVGGRRTTGQRHQTGRQAPNADSGLVHDTDQFVEGFVIGAAAQRDEDSGGDVDHPTRSVVTYAITHA